MPIIHKEYKNFRPSGHIISLDELARQEFIFWRGTLVNCGWFMNWQLHMAKNVIGENGVVFYAIKEEQKDG